MLTSIFSCNHLSEWKHTDIISANIQKEWRERRFLGPLPIDVTGVHFNPIELIPKLHQPSNYRLLLHKQCLCEWQISPDLCFLHYTLVDEAVILVLSLGQGALMAKTNLKSVYYKVHVPVHPDDQDLLGVCWDNHAWLDMAFPLGLC